MRLNRYIHLGKDVANDAPLVVLGNIGELGPGKGMVEIVLHLIVLRKTEEVAVLHVQQVLRLVTNRKRTTMSITISEVCCL